MKGWIESTTGTSAVHINLGQVTRIEEFGRKTRVYFHGFAATAVDPDSVLLAEQYQAIIEKIRDAVS
jgi:hypothetical protein